GPERGQASHVGNVSEPAAWTIDCFSHGREHALDIANVVRRLYQPGLAARPEAGIGRTGITPAVVKALVTLVNVKARDWTSKSVSEDAFRAAGEHIAYDCRGFVIAPTGAIEVRQVVPVVNEAIARCVRVQRSIAVLKPVFVARDASRAGRKIVSEVRE